jgi:hypothetical protein
MADYSFAATSVSAATSRSRLKPLIEHVHRWGTELWRTTGVSWY